MPPKRSGSGSGSTSGSSSSSSGSSSSSSSDSSSSGSDSSSDSESSASQASGKSKQHRSSAASSTASSENESPQKKKTQKPTSGSHHQSSKKPGAITRSRSASSASTSDSESNAKKSDKKSKKSQSKTSVQPRAVPKKSATAKPITKAVPTSKKQLSDNDSDSDFGDFSLPKLAAKAKQAKKAASEAAAALASLSPASQSSPSAKSLPSSTPILQPSKLAASMSSLSSAKPDLQPSSSKVPAKSGSTILTSTPAANVDKSKMKSIFSESSGTSSGSSSDSEAPAPPAPSTVSAPKTAKQTKKKVPPPPTPAATTPSTVKRRSPSPPKLTPQKKTPSPAKTPGKRGRPLGSGSKKNTTSLGAAAVAGLAARATASAAKMQSKKKPGAKKRGTSSLSSASGSNSAASSASSSSDSSDSSSEEKEEEKPSKKKSNPPSTTKAPSNTKAKAPQTKIKEKENNPPAKKATVQITNTSVMQSTDSESGKIARLTTRKTRGANVRKSRHVTGKNVSDSDSDTEMPTGRGAKGLTPNTSVTTQSKKKYTVQFPPVRKEIEGLQPMEKRSCPMQGCDSSGHLGGKLDRHFLLESCPVYHNLTRKACRDFRVDTSKRASARKKALTALATKSPLGSPTSEQKKNAKMIQEARSRFRDEDIPTTDDMPEDCEPDLNCFTSEWDLQIFREAQAEASEVIEETMRGLPDTKQTRYLEMGSFEMEVWYQSPYPDDIGTLPKIYICEFCLKYHRSATQLRRHAAKCVWNHPPGDEIYRKEPISVFEICGKRYKQYCQSLCLLAKFFLDHKTLYFDVEPFLFYVMTTADSAGCHIVGYFSKEKNSVLNYNVSCILTLPPYQRQGYGRLLIDFSYLLSKSENKIGSPEKPLSDLGLITYRAYWKDVLLEYICNYPDKEISIKEISEKKGINSNDIISTLQYMGMIKYWKGQHLILKREDLIKDYMEKSNIRSRGRQIDDSALKWKPYQPSAKERKQAEQIKKNQEKQKKR